MKSNYRYIVKAFMAMAVIAGTTSCDDFLDREPMSSISPETYYSTAAQLEANLNDEYPNVLPSFGQWTYGIFGEDKGTDNQIEVTAIPRIAGKYLIAKVTIGSSNASIVLISFCLKHFPNSVRT